MQKSTIAELRAAARNIIAGTLPEFPGQTIAKTAKLVEFLKQNPGIHTARDLGKIVGWGDRQTRSALAAIGIKGDQGKGYRWK